VEWRVFERKRGREEVENKKGRKNSGTIFGGGERKERKEVVSVSGMRVMILTPSLRESGRSFWA
jgi:hypothetical protein